MEPNYGNKYQQKKVFIEAFGKYGLIKHASYLAGISQTTVYRWLDEDSEFYEQYLEAGSIAVQTNKLLADVPIHKRCEAIHYAFDSGDDKTSE